MMFKNTIMATNSQSQKSRTDSTSYYQRLFNEQKNARKKGGMTGQVYKKASGKNNDYVIVSR